MLVILATYFVMSCICFLLYAKDKRAAANQQRRISEQTLWIIGLLCGWPGALIGQKLLRHKTAKPSFLIVFWLTVLLNVGALCGFLWF
jgi:uncharacterized membrane protein YsdA (DUF1294 family)